MRVVTEKSAFGGNTIARHEGKILFIQGGIPGETVELDIIEDNQDYAIAAITSIIEQSPDRITPECPNSGRCGGCDYLQMTYDRELIEKRAIISDALVRTAKIANHLIPKIDTISDNRFYYRSHAHIKTSSKGAGFFAKNSHDLVIFPKEGCLLLNRECSRYISKMNHGGEIAVAIDDKGVVTASKSSVISEKCTGIIFKRDINSFFQANQLLRDRMIDRVIEYAGGNHSDRVLDLGCGCGFFSLPLAGKFSHVDGIDISAESIRFAIENAAMNGISNVQFSTRDFSALNAKRDAAQLVIVDPPRAGIPKKTKASLLKMNPARIIYVSCNPSTWARDIGELIGGGYTLAKATFIDMFPATMHIEIISQLIRR
jgi:tRNA/tmRNA/rRNA uracil-C5-methylase (TrmA/RlmC/RlmD family)